jgi:hypothetical protein
MVSAWDQMKPRTVYEKALQDFTETARRLARLDQHFRQASFAEFKMLMAFEAFDDEALKRYGLSKPMASRRSSKCIKPSCSVSRDDGFSKDHDNDHAAQRLRVSLSLPRSNSSLRKEQ